MARVVAMRPPRIAMSLVLVAVAAHLLVRVPLHASLPLAGAAIGLAGFLLMLRAWWLFREAGTAICPTEASTTLVTRDVFALSRNPMYLGIVLILAGLAAAAGTLPFHMAWIAFAGVMDRCFCPYEERKALAEFGEAYRDYARRVRRWL